MMRLSLYLCILLGCLYFAPAAHAAGPGLDLDTCAGDGFTANEYVAKVVFCVKNKLTEVAISMMQQLTTYIAPVVGFMFVYSVILFGIQVAAGEREISRKSIAFLIKLALVWMFCRNLGGYANSLFQIMDGLVNLAAGGYSPWQQIDTFLGKMFGFGRESTLVQGMVGMVGAAMFSGSTGFTLGMAGIMALLNLLMFAFDVVFTYLAAVMLLCFMVILSPFFVPMALFKHTEKYFDKWLKIIASAMLTPILLFAFLSLTLGVFLTLIANIYAVMGDPNNPDFRAVWRINQPVVSWQMASDPAAFARLSGPTGTLALTSPVGGNIDPAARDAQDMFSLLLPAINFGLANQEIMQRLIFAFVTLWLYASTIKGMVAKIPGIATDMSGAIGIRDLRGGSFQSKMHDTAENIKIGGGALGGAMLGAQVGGAIGNRSARARQAGGILGGVTGAMIGSRL